MDRHLLITGQGRAGSTLFYSMMQHTLMGFQMPDLEVRARQVMQMEGNTCNKRPYDIFDYAEIARLAQGRKQLDLIITLRDPRDILTSRHPAVPDDYFYSADRTYFIAGTAPPVRSMPGLLLTHVKIVEALQSGLFPRGAFLLKYEHLVDDPARIQQLLSDGMGLTFHGRFEDFHTRQVDQQMARAMNGQRPVSATRVQKWRAPEHRARIIDQFTRFPALHDIVIDLGYEADTTWFEAFLDDDATEPVSRMPQSARR